MRISAKTNMCVIIGDPVAHSLSPQMHNAAYEALGIDDQFVFLGAHVKVENVGEVVKAMQVMNIRGLTCTIPHKQEVMKFIEEDHIHPVARKIGAVNTVVHENGIVKGCNTDWLGVLTPLQQVTSLQGKQVAVVGAGGAARAMIYAVTSKGASFTVYNRTIDRAEALAREFGGEAKSIEDIADVSHADIILNATSLGMHPQVEETPILKKYIHHKQIVFDAIYTPYETKLLRDAKEQGANIIHGLDMLLYQGLAQFELYTGHKAPESVMRKVLMNHI